MQLKRSPSPVDMPHLVVSYSAYLMIVHAAAWFMPSLSVLSCRVLHRCSSYCICYVAAADGGSGDKAPATAEASSPAAAMSDSLSDSQSDSSASDETAGPVPSLHSDGEDSSSAADEDIADVAASDVSVSDVEAAVDALDIANTSGDAASEAGTRPGVGSSLPATTDGAGSESKTALDDFLDSAADPRATDFTRSLSAVGSGGGCTNLQVSSRRFSGMQADCSLRDFVGIASPLLLDVGHMSIVFVVVGAFVLVATY